MILFQQIFWLDCSILNDILCLVGVKDESKEKLSRIRGGEENLKQDPEKTYWSRQKYGLEMDDSIRVVQ